MARFSPLCKYFTGRPTPLYFAKNLTEKLGGAKIYLKREDLNHTGAHKINHCLGQILLAKMMGKTRIIAETEQGNMVLQPLQYVLYLICLVLYIKVKLI